MTPDLLAILWIGGTQLYLQAGLLLKVFVDDNWGCTTPTVWEALLFIVLWPLVVLFLIYVPEE